MLSVKWRWIGQTSTALVLLFACTGCGTGSGVWTVHGVIRNSDSGDARLLLELHAGTGVDQPGWAPERVGGVSARGPLSLAVDGSDIFIADQAKGRILHFRDGQLAGSIPTPWMEEQGVDLGITSEGLVVSSPYRVFTIDRQGRILKIEDRSVLEDAEPEKGAVRGAGTDQFGNSYYYGFAEQGTMVERIGEGGKQLVRGLISEPVVDSYVSDEGGFYGLTWHGGAEPYSVQVYEVLEPVAAPQASGEGAPAEPPKFRGESVPEVVNYSSSAWAPIAIRDVSAWNLWQILDAGSPAPEGTTPLGPLVAKLEAGDLTVDLYRDHFVVDEETYVLPHADAFWAIISAELYSKGGLEAALQGDIEVQVAIADLPDAASTLAADQVLNNLADAYTVNRYTPPQPLEEPFPRYELRLKGDGWEGSLTVSGDYLVPSGTAVQGTALYAGTLTGLLRQSLPVPDLPDGSLEALYRADRLEIGDGVDLTRWKNTVVRSLLGLIPQQGTVENQEPVTLTFYLDGQQHVVEIDAGGFTYAGQRYDRPGLTGLANLQGVP